MSLYPTEIAEIPSSSYKAQVEFQFAKGYIEKGGIPEIEDTISQVLSFDDSGDQSAQSTSEVLTSPTDHRFECNCRTQYDRRK